LLTIPLLVLVLASCSTKPEAIVLGKDQCHFCKMTIVDEQFGAELVTKKGKVYKFDDMKCFLDYYNSGHESQDIYEHKLVVDFAGNGALIDAAGAHYLTSPEIRSPMNGQVAAFQSKPAMDEANKQWNGNHVSWEELAGQSR
jgi:copper chaperone NosL